MATTLKARSGAAVDPDSETHYAKLVADKDRVIAAIGNGAKSWDTVAQASGMPVADAALAISRELVASSTTAPQMKPRHPERLEKIAALLFGGTTDLSDISQQTGIKRDHVSDCIRQWFNKPLRDHAPAEEPAAEDNTKKQKSPPKQTAYDNWSADAPLRLPPNEVNAINRLIGIALDGRKPEAFADQTIAYYRQQNIQPPPARKFLVRLVGYPASGLVASRDFFLRLPDILKKPATELYGSSMAYARFQQNAPKPPAPPAAPSKGHHTVVRPKATGREVTNKAPKGQPGGTLDLRIFGGRKKSNEPSMKGREHRFEDYDLPPPPAPPPADGKKKVGRPKVEIPLARLSPDHGRVRQTYGIIFKPLADMGNADGICTYTTRFMETVGDGRKRKKVLGGWMQCEAEVAKPVEGTRRMEYCAAHHQLINKRPAEPSLKELAERAIAKAGTPSGP